MSGLIWSQAPAWSRKDRLVAEERINQVTHGLGTLLATGAAAAVIMRALDYGNPWLTAGCVIYGVTLVLVFLASTLSHSFLRGTWKHSFRSLDQIAIFLVMAGTYTPIGLTIAWQNGYWIILLAMWVLAVSGIVAKLFITGIRNVPVPFYVVIGWLPILAARPMMDVLPGHAIYWILASGLCFMVGTFFLSNDRRAPWFHAVWHLLVIAGTACQFAVIYDCVVPVAG